MSESYYPPVDFYFSLSIAGISEELDTSFKEISGISTQMTTEEIKEGGENKFKHRVPPALKYENLVLRRGITLKDSSLAKWCINTINNQMTSPIETKTLIVKLLDTKGSPLMKWTFSNAYPIKWSIGNSNLNNTELMIETLEFAYSYFTTTKK